jgi:hypothetical protein
MVSQTYIYLLAIAATLVSVTGAYFSVTGLATLFSGAAVSVLVMAGALEFSKFVVVGFVYRYWGHIHKPLKVYLIFSVVVLVMITSTGIYGYLSNAYQVASVGLHTHIMKMENLEAEKERIDTQISEMQAFIENIPKSRITKKFEFHREYEPKIKRLRKQAELVITEIAAKKQEFLSMQTKAGPAVYLAKTFGTDVDTVVSWFILVFVSVFDPLAVSLVFSLNLLIRLREKYRGDEYKIGARSLTSPVDHRFKRAA